MDPATLMALINAGKQLGSSFAGIGTGLFGNSGAPYQAAEKELGDFYNRATGFQNPFIQMGTGAIPQYQQWLQGQQNPSGFINQLMGQYQQSPGAKYLQDQAMRAAQNMGSATGLTGSTPLTQYAQQQATGISAQDMQNWLQNVLGINTQYGQGLGSMVSGGQNAANVLSQLAQGFGQDIAGMQYGKTAGQQADRASLFGGLFGLL